jgi:hypothetical protein
MLLVLNFGFLIYTIILRPLSIKINNFIKIFAEINLICLLAIYIYVEVLNQ